MEPHGGWKDVNTLLRQYDSLYAKPDWGKILKEMKREARFRRIKRAFHSLKYRLTSIFKNKEEQSKKLFSRISAKYRTSKRGELKYNLILEQFRRILVKTLKLFTILRGWGFITYETYLSFIRLYVDMMNAFTILQVTHPVFPFHATFSPFDKRKVHLGIRLSKIRGME